MRIPYCSFMSFGSSWAEGDTILYGVNVNKRYRRRVASALKKRRHRNKIHFEASFYHPGQKGKSILGTHHIKPKPLDVVKCIRTCKSPFPNFFLFIYFFFLLCEFSFSWPFDRDAANRGLGFVSICEQSPSCHPGVFSYRRVFHFLAFSLSFFDSPFFFSPLFSYTPSQP